MKKKIMFTVILACFMFLCVLTESAKVINVRKDNKIEKNVFNENFISNLSDQEIYQIIRLTTCDKHLYMIAGSGGDVGLCKFTFCDIFNLKNFRIKKRIQLKNKYVRITNINNVIFGVVQDQKSEDLDLHLFKFKIH